MSGFYTIAELDEIHERRAGERRRERRIESDRRDAKRAAADFCELMERLALAADDWRLLSNYIEEDSHATTRARFAIRESFGR
jgi:hypothetical protein